MPAHHLLRQLRAAGLRVSVNTDNRLVLAPAAHLTPELRAAVQAARADLVALVQGEATTDPDRWSWPHSTAANTAEVHTLTKRLALFAARGLALPDAERLADALLLRDREGDHRGACAECRRLVGTDPSRWRCTDRHPGNQVAGLGVPALLVHQHLHHCPSHAAH